MVDYRGVLGGYTDGDRDRRVKPEYFVTEGIEVGEVVDVGGCDGRGW